MKTFENAEKWSKADCWVAYFDILGFANLMAVENDDPKAFDVCLN